MSLCNSFFLFVVILRRDNIVCQTEQHVKLFYSFVDVFVLYFESNAIQSMKMNFNDYYIIAQMGLLWLTIIQEGTKLH